MSVWKDALAFTLRWEGGYVNDPDDPGGATNKGITQQTYNSWLRKKSRDPADVRFITDEEVEQIYFEDYWMAGMCDILHLEGFAKVAQAHFDACVNHGPRQAKRFLERAWPVARMWSELFERQVLQEMLMRREAFYHDIVRRRASSEKFLKGWLRRLNDLRRFVGLTGGS